MKLKSRSMSWLDVWNTYILYFYFDKKIPYPELKNEKSVYWSLMHQSWCNISLKTDLGYDI